MSQDIVYISNIHVFITIKWQLNGKVILWKYLHPLQIFCLLNFYINSLCSHFGLVYRYEQYNQNLCTPPLT